MKNRYGIAEVHEVAAAGYMGYTDHVMQCIAAGYFESSGFEHPDYTARLIQSMNNMSIKECLKNIWIRYVLSYIFKAEFSTGFAVHNNIAGREF